MVLEYVDHTVKDLLESMKRTFHQSEVKCLMVQLLEGIKYLHDHWIIHRDLKTSNLLLDDNGTLKICDFGLARKYGNPLREYSPIVVTLWYRPPELLMGCKKYAPSIDLWSIGCIFFELMVRKPLFTGNTEIEQLTMIFNELGYPTQEKWPSFTKLPNFKSCKKSSVNKQFSLHKYFNVPNNADLALSKNGMDLLTRLLEYDPEKRITAAEALEHPYFKEDPIPVIKSKMPHFPATNMTPPSARKRKREGNDAAKRRRK